MINEYQIEENLIKQLSVLNNTKPYENILYFRSHQEKLTDHLEALELSWKEPILKELALMEDLVLQLKKITQGYYISGLLAYE